MSGYQTRSGTLEQVVDFLLPSGILIPLKCKDSDTLEKVKERVWEEAKQFPLFGLRQPEWYTLVFVNCKAEQEECLDESQRLSDIQMYKPVFKVLSVGMSVNNFCYCVIGVCVLRIVGRERRVKSDKNMSITTSPLTKGLSLLYRAGIY